jgi:hypothetical protein
LVVSTPIILGGDGGGYDCCQECGERRPPKAPETFIERPEEYPPRPPLADLVFEGRLPDYRPSYDGLLPEYQQRPPVELRPHPYDFQGAFPGSGGVGPFPEQRPIPERPSGAFPPIRPPGPNMPERGSGAFPPITPGGGAFPSRR